MALTPGDISQRFGIILGGIGRGLSGNAIIRELQAAGLGLRLTTLRSLIATARTYWTSQPTIASADLDVPLVPDANLKWPTARQTGFGYVVKVAYRDVGTGAIDTLHFTAISDTPLSPRQAIDQAFQLPPSYFGEAERVPVGAAVTNAFNYVPTVV